MSRTLFLLLWAFTGFWSKSLWRKDSRFIANLKTVPKIVFGNPDVSCSKVIAVANLLTVSLWSLVWLPPLPPRSDPILPDFLNPTFSLESFHVFGLCVYPLSWLPTTNCQTIQDKTGKRTPPAQVYLSHRFSRRPLGVWKERWIRCLTLPNLAQFLHFTLLPFRDTIRG